MPESALAKTIWFIAIVVLSALFVFFVAAVDVNHGQSSSAPERINRCLTNYLTPLA